MTLSGPKLKQIEDLLDSTLFGLSAFEITTPQKAPPGGMVVLVRIAYKDNKRFFIELGQQSAGHYHAITSPGLWLSQETITLQNIGTFSGAVTGWVGRVMNEVSLIGAVDRQLEKFRQELETKLDQHCADKEQHFGPGERQMWLEKLAALHKKLEELEGKDAVRKSQIEKLNKALAELAKVIDAMPRKSWIRTAISRLGEFAIRYSATEDGRALIENVIVGLLGNSGEK